MNSRRSTASTSLRRVPIPLGQISLARQRPPAWLRHRTGEQKSRGPHGWVARSAPLGSVNRNQGGKKALQAEKLSHSAGEARKGRALELSGSLRVNLCYSFFHGWKTQ